MKKILLLICIISISLQSFGQAKKYGISLTIANPNQDEINTLSGPYMENLGTYNIKRNSYAVGILANYQISDTVMIRLRFGVTSINKNIYENFLDINKYEYTIKDQQTILHFAPGIIWKIKFHKFDLYSGFEVPFNLIGKYTSKFNSTNTDTSGNIASWGKSTDTNPKGYSLGLGGLFGFTYSPFKWVSLGTEFSPSILYSKFSGKISHESTSSNFPDLYTESMQYENKGSAFYAQRFSINVSIWF